ncbi:MAG: translation initiation factor IF-2, partial [Zetaproteobacteria bacterium]|nr:translation initiation factor IF-2 [Zetaproteobacteria bacterium]
DRPAGNRPAGNRPAAGNRPQRTDGNNRPQGNRAASSARPDPRSNTPANNTGPRTTIRGNLSLEAIRKIKDKAPRSTVKELEKNIGQERAAMKRRAAGNRNQGNAAGAGNNASRPPRQDNSAATTQNRGQSVSISPDAAALLAANSAMDAAPKRLGAGAAAKTATPMNKVPRRRLTPAEKAAKREYDSKRHVVMTEDQEDRMARLAKGKRKKSRSIGKDDEDFVIREVEITDPILISTLASRMAIKTVDVLKETMGMGLMATANDFIDGETAVLIVEELGHKAKLIDESQVEHVLVDDASDEENLKERPPVVVVMGHVDHGKTSILDALRKATVAAGEAGGITQHIGAYMVKLDGGERVVFIDTPGHEAFTGLRARGAKMTDVAVLVVAADDGVKPQTIEALNHARAAGVPLIVAVNKMDKEGADPEMVKRQLADHNVISEDWGGDSIFVNVSAKTGLGLNELLEMLALQTEILELKADPTRRGRGVVIESRLDKGRGPVATVLVQNGTFSKGDIVVVGEVTGRIRAIVDENSVQHRTAGPSIPFELLGLESVPEAGQEIVAVENDRQAREIISYRKEHARREKEKAHTRSSFDELFADAKSDMAEVPVVIKGDVTGSVEAMAESLIKAGTDEVKVKVVHRAIGGITESDVMLAAASKSIVIGFNVRPSAKAKKLAETEGVEIRFYRVIYDAIDDIKAAMAGQLAPNQVEKVIGSAEVRDVFTIPKIGAIAGSYVTDGYIVRNARVRVLRDDILIYEGKLASLRRFKDDVKEVKTGYECGIGVENFNDVKAGDSFEFYIIEEVAATL